MKLVIQGIGVLGGFGCGIEALRTALIDRKYRTQSVSIKTAQGPREMPVFLADTVKLDDFLSKKALRRVDHFSKMALLGSYLALQDAGQLEGDRQRMGMIVATGYGASRTTFAFLDSFVNDGDQLSSPTHFSNSVHNAARRKYLHGSGHNRAGFDREPVRDVRPVGPSHCRNLAGGRPGRFGAFWRRLMNIVILLGYCWHRFFGDTVGGVQDMKPMAFNLQSAIPGEGAAFLLLTRAVEGSQSPYGFIGDVDMGRYGRGPLGVAEETLYFIGADGHKQCGSFYKRLLPEQASTACYTPLYGSLPVGPAFDLAIAALSIKNKKVFPSPNGSSEGLEMRIIREETDFGWEKICCLKIGGEGEWGRISLSPFPINPS